MRVVIELKRGEVPEIVLNNLYAQTPMETVFGINMVALVDGQPRLLSLKEMLDAFLRHRREVVTRRTVYDLRKARERGHVLEGLAIALANIDDIIAAIKASPSPAEARAALVSRVWASGAVPQMLERAGGISTRPDGESPPLGIVAGGYRLTEMQAQAILDMRLHRLTGLEQDKIIAEYEELLTLIRDLSRHPGAPRAAARSHPQRARGDPRQLLRQAPHRDHLDARGSHHRGSDFPRGSRGDAVAWRLCQGSAGVGLPGAAARRPRQGGDHRQGRGLHRPLFVANTHDTLLCFSDRGKLYWLKVYQLPQASRGSRGKPIVNLLAAAGRRAHQRHAADQGVRGEQVRVHGDEPRHGQEDFARSVLPAARERHHRGRARCRRQAGRGRHHGWQQRHPAVHHRRQGDPLPRGRGAADGTRGGRRARHQARARSSASMR